MQAVAAKHEQLTITHVGKQTGLSLLALILFYYIYSDVKIMYCRLVIFWLLKQTNWNIESSLCEILISADSQSNLLFAGEEEL